MKLFLSYSRDDKAWVYGLWRALRDRAYHDAWIDNILVPAQDWWETILQSIEICECFIYVMTPKSVESIYCTAEFEYAIALNKPIIPLMLKSCDTPAEIKKRRIQYSIINDSDSLGDVLFTVERALSEVRVGLIQGKYPPPQTTPNRPAEPTPGKKPEHISEVFMLAEEAAHAKNFSLAEKLFQQVIDTDPQGYGLAAAERLAEVRYERIRNQEYLNIVHMANNPTMRKGALALWRVFTQKYGTEYDPNNVPSLLAEKIATAVFVKQHSVLNILQPPFAWVNIPAGKVTLGTYYTTGYITKPTEFDVPAFAIAKYPITNAQFAKFIEAGGYKEKKWWTHTGWEAREKGLMWNINSYKTTNIPWTEPRYWQDKKWNGADYPIVGVSWYEAIAFCLWLSETTEHEITLPTDQQWQRAAQGDRKWEYPWGNKFDARRCNFNSSGTTPVTRYEGQGDSPFGVADMSGNVWEWCLTEYTSGNIDINSTHPRIVLGCSWYSKLKEDLRTDRRSYGYPQDRNTTNGFRLVQL